MRLFLLTFLFFYCCSVNAQAQPEQDKGTQLRTAGRLNEAIAAFRKVYDTNPLAAENVYALAAAYAQQRQPDSCFKYLYAACRLMTTDEILTDPDLYPVRRDKRWEDFETQLCKLLQSRYNTSYKDPDYARKLWALAAADQAYYADIKIAELALGTGNSVSLSLWDLKEKINTENRQELEALIAQNGWPKQSEVGAQAANAAFLVVQHWDATQQKKYLPVLKALCTAKEANWQAYALMYDRVQISEGKPQKYGSQVQFNTHNQAYELLPLEDAARVDEWRNEAGMGPLANYVAQWHIQWPPVKK